MPNKAFKRTASPPLNLGVRHMNRFVFMFGYESPIEHETNIRSGTDFESSEAVWVRAISEREAMQRGRVYATAFVAQQFAQAGVTDFVGWAEGNFSHWVEREPENRFSASELEAMNEI